MPAGGAAPLALAFSAGALASTGVLLLALGKWGWIRRRLLLDKVSTVPPPHPGWTPGQPQPSPYADLKFITVDPAQLGGPACYPLVISAGVPRPIAFVTSVSADGRVHNLAPYSYFNMVAHDPPHVAIGMCHTPAKQGGKKDTLTNIQQSRQFVVNIISDWFIEAANHCCGMFDYGEDEMQLAGLTPLPSERVLPPRVAESAVQLECELAHEYEVINSKGDVSTTVVIGRVVLAHVNEGVAARTPTGKLMVDFNKLRPMCRLGGDTYGQVTATFDLPRPDRSSK